MATATINFDLEDFDDKLKHFQMIKAQDMSFALFEFARNSRRKIESSMKEGENYYDAIDKTYEAFFEILEDCNINLDELCM